MIEMAYVHVGNTLQFDVGLCIGCEMCSTVCPHGVFAMRGRVAEVVCRDACMECGACQTNCPVGAIKVDSGVGCAAAMVRAALTGRDRATCDDGSEASCCCAGE